MSARETIRNVLLVHYANSPNPALVVDTLLANEHAEAGLLPKADVVAWLVKKAREETPVWLLASKVERGAVRPDNLRMLPADFFEPGHAYTRAPWRFRCEAVTIHPDTGEKRAIGWRRIAVDGDLGWDTTALDPDDWTHGGWTDVTEGGAS